MIAAWHRDRGDETLRLDYPLDAGSVVLDVGGFRGQWAREIHARFGCEVHVFEPVPQFAEEIRGRFADHPKIQVHGFGLSAVSGRRRFSVDGDASSAFRPSKVEIEVEMQDVASWLAGNGIDEAHLMKINVEGAEFELIERLLDSGWIHRIRDLQVQFHPFVERARARRREIQGRLALTHRLIYEYPFVWESWRRKPAEGAAA